eukprot:jgi/Ulvmu1/5332/UM022_0126.1
MESSPTPLLLALTQMQEHAQSEIVAAAPDNAIVDDAPHGTYCSIAHGCAASTAVADAWAWATDKAVLQSPAPAFKNRHRHYVELPAPSKTPPAVRLPLLAPSLLGLSDTRTPPSSTSIPTPGDPIFDPFYHSCNLGSETPSASSTTEGPHTADGRLAAALGTWAAAIAVLGFLSGVAATLIVLQPSTAKRHSDAPPASPPHRRSTTPVPIRMRRKKRLALSLVRTGAATTPASPTSEGPTSPRLQAFFPSDLAPEPAHAAPSSPAPVIEVVSQPAAPAPATEVVPPPAAAPTAAPAAPFNLWTVLGKPLRKIACYPLRLALPAPERLDTFTCCGDFRPKVPASKVLLAEDALYSYCLVTQWTVVTEVAQPVVFNPARPGEFIPLCSSFERTYEAAKHEFLAERGQEHFPAQEHESNKRGWVRNYCTETLSTFLTRFGLYVNVFNDPPETSVA